MLSPAEMRFSGFVLGISLLLTLSACGGRSPSTQHAGEGLDSPGALAGLLPAGAEVVALLEPSALRSAGPTRDMVDSIAGPGFLDSIRIRTGVDVMALHELVVGVYGDDLLLIARGPQSANDVVTVLGMRMSHTLSSSDEPARRVGFLNGDLWHAIAFGERVFAIAIGDGEQLPAVHERVRLGHWPEGESGVVGGSEVRRVSERIVRGPARVLLPQPLDLPQDSPLGLVLAQERVMGLSLVPVASDRVGVEIGIVGELPERAERNLRQWITSMAGADLGRALGLEAGLDSLRVQANAEDAWIRVDLPSTDLCRGLRILFGAELREITEGLIHDVVPDGVAPNAPRERAPLFEGIGRGSRAQEEAAPMTAGSADDE